MPKFYSFKTRYRFSNKFLLQHGPWVKLFGLICSPELCQIGILPKPASGLSIFHQGRSHWRNQSPWVGQWSLISQILIFKNMMMPQSPQNLVSSLGPQQKKARIGCTIFVPGTVFDFTPKISWKDASTKQPQLLNDLSKANSSPYKLPAL